MVEKFRTITSQRTKHYKYLAKILKFNSPQELISRLQLLFRASEHDFSASEFHKYCDNKGPTITIIKSYNKLIFGGYASQSWFSKGGFSKAPGSFLFSLNKETKHEIYQFQGYAIEGNKHWGPIFSNDLYLSNNCYVNGGFGSLGYTYCKMSDSHNLRKSISHLGGSSDFQVEDYEVFSLDRKI